MRCAGPCRRSYLARLIRGGFRVAIAEQIESPAEARKARGSKALVERAIIRLVTPGTLTEETLLECGSANWLAAVARAGDEWAIAAADISTGRFEMVACGPGELQAELARLSPAETISAENVPGVTVTPGKGGFDSLAGERALKDRFGVATLDGFGAPGRAELAAAGGLLAYLHATQKDASAFLGAPKRDCPFRTHGDRPATRDSLEICRTQAGSRGGKPAGLHRPLRHGARPPPARRGPQCAANRRSSDRSAIGASPMASRRAYPPRAFARSAQGHARHRARARPPCRRSGFSPRDLALLRDGLRASAALKAGLESEPERPDLLAALLPDLGGHAALTDRLCAALVDSPPLDASKGGYIAEGYDAALDALRSTGSDGRRAIAALEARYREATGVSTLKIRHNAVLGYHIEVSARHADRLMAPDSGFIHRQTLAGVVRFNSPDLHSRGEPRRRSRSPRPVRRGRSF